MQEFRPVAVVTGASSGIGSVFARRLAKQGYDLVLVARREDRLEELSKELEAQHGIGAEALPADLASDEGLRLAEERIARAGRLEFLVNNAGFGTRGRFFEIGVESQDTMHRLHVIATMRLSHAALPGMVARGKGNLVNVSSVAGFGQTPGNASYCATKAWINSFTEGLYLELKSAGSPVRIQSLCPGFTATEFHDVMGVDRKSIPGGLWMSAEEVVDASFRGLATNRLFVVPGWRYRLIVLFQKLTPQSLRQFAAIKYSRKTRRDRAQ